MDSTTTLCETHKEGCGWVIDGFTFGDILCGLSVKLKCKKASKLDVDVFARRSHFYKGFIASDSRDLSIEHKKLTSRHITLYEIRGYCLHLILEEYFENTYQLLVRNGRKPLPVITITMSFKELDGLELNPEDITLEAIVKKAPADYLVIHNDDSEDDDSEDEE